MLRDLLYLVILGFGISSFVVTANAQTGIRGNWKVVLMVEKPDAEIIPENGSVTLTIRSKNFVGSGGCNNLSGEYKISGKKIKFAKLSTTLMLCDSRHYDEVYVGLLRKTASYSLKEKNLIFKDKSGRTILKFERVKS